MLVMLCLCASPSAMGGHGSFLRAGLLCLFISPEPPRDVVCVLQQAHRHWCRGSSLTSCKLGYSSFMGR